VAKLDSYRDLIVWQRARDLSLMCYRVTSAFPADEKFGLTGQLRRAAVSVCANIAEGYGRFSRPDYLRHLRIAHGSLMEVSVCIEIAGSLKMLPPCEQKALDTLHDETSRMLRALIRKLETRSAP